MSSRLGVEWVCWDRLPPLPDDRPIPKVSKAPEWYRGIRRYQDESSLAVIDAMGHMFGEDMRCVRCNLEHAAHHRKPAVCEVPAVKWEPIEVTCDRGHVYLRKSKAMRCQVCRLGKW